MAKITLRIKGQADRDYRIEDRLSIGRRTSNDIVLKDTLCSRDHAIVYESAGAYRVRDLGSHNGTFLNEEKISEQELEEHDVIRIGSVELHFFRSAVDALLGERLSGYKILEVLGEGGMGKVYKARQIAMDRIVALKVLSEKVTEDESFVAAFKQEAKVAGQLNHNNVVSVHDFGRTDNGLYFLSMEFIDGENIEQILEKKGKLSAEQSVAVVSEVSKALNFAHEKEIVHSDIKPQNILVDSSGNVKVADLGLAKYLGKSSFDRKKDTVMGTPYYMSPEQATKSRVDSRTDIYSLGATFFHMLTGRPPFDGETSLTILTKHVTEEVPSPRTYDITISTRIANLIQWMMEKDPDDRPADMAEVLAELQSIKAEEKGVTAAGTSAAARKGYVADIRRSMAARRKKAKTRQTVSAITSIAAALVIIGGAALLLPKYLNKHLGLNTLSNTHSPDPSQNREHKNSGNADSGNHSEVPADSDTLELTFKDIAHKDMLEPLGTEQWNGWRFEPRRGFLESPPGLSTGFTCKDERFSSRSFTAELVVRFVTLNGSVSFSIEGNRKNESVGVHLNPDEIILFSEHSRRKIQHRLKKRTRIAVAVSVRPGRNLQLMIDGKKVAEVEAPERVFSGTSTVRIENTVLQVYYMKITR